MNIFLNFRRFLDSVFWLHFVLLQFMLLIPRCNCEKIGMNYQKIADGHPIFYDLNNKFHLSRGEICQKSTTFRHFEGTVIFLLETVWNEQYYRHAPLVSLWTWKICVTIVGKKRLFALFPFITLFGDKEVSLLNFS